MMRTDPLRARLKTPPLTDTGGRAWFAEPSPPALDEPFHHAWTAHEGEPYVVRLAIACAAECAAVRPRVSPDELVIGDWGPNPIVSGRETPFGNGIRLNREQAELIRAERPEAAAEIDAILDYWQPWLRANRDRFPPTCHASLAYEIPLESGLDGLRAKVARWASVHGDRDAATADWYRALDLTVGGLSDFITAHADAAAALGLADVAERCRWVAHHPPRTFADAVQLAYLMFLLGGHDSPGPIDRYLWPALRRDLETGSTTLGEAQEYIDALWLKYAEKIAYGATIGGQLADGGDATNPVSFLCLEAIDRLRLLSPRTTLRWHPDLDPAFWRRAVEVIAAGAAYPALVNDVSVIQAAVDRGTPLECARDYTFVGCGQVYPHGRGHGSYEDVVISAARPLELALRGGRDRDGRQVGPATGEADSFSTYAEFEAAYRAQMAHHLAERIDHVNERRRAAVGQGFDLVRSLLSYSCVERGLDWHAGGCDLSEGMVDVVGLATLTDSLHAIRVGVFDQQLLGLPELTACLEADWADAEPLRRRFLALPKYGNNDPEADAATAAEAAWINTEIGRHRTAFGGPWGLDIIGWSGALLFGEETGATPDGRRRGESLADCAGPAQGRNQAGLFSTLEATLGLPHAASHGPLALSLRFPRESVDGERGRAALRSMIETYFQRGGQHLQISIAGTADLRAARQRPEDYRWLIVRVGGFNAYFTELDERWQEDMIRRAEMRL